MKISILGYGNFGSGFGTYLTRLNHEIIKEEVSDAEIVIVSVPSFAVVPTLLNVKKDLAGKKIVICSKGFTSDGRLISDVLKENSIDNVFFLYGPTLIDGIVNGEISAMVLAGGEGKEEIKKQIESDKLRIELSEDVVGVQVGAALKNVMTMFIGMAEGAGYGKNTQAFILTRCLQEIQKFGIALGAKPETFLGLSCSGDLTMNSRNRCFGIELGKGKNIDDATSCLTYTLEGISTLKSAKKMMETFKIKSPIIDLIFVVLFEGYSIHEAIDNLE